MSRLTGQRSATRRCQRRRDSAVNDHERNPRDHLFNDVLKPDTTVSRASPARLTCPNEPASAYVTTGQRFAPSSATEDTDTALLPTPTTSPQPQHGPTCAQSEAREIAAIATVRKPFFFEFPAHSRHKPCKTQLCSTVERAGRVHVQIWHWR